MILLLALLSLAFLTLMGVHLVLHAVARRPGWELLLAGGISFVVQFLVYVQLCPQDLFLGGLAIVLFPITHGLAIGLLAAGLLLGVVRRRGMPPAGERFWVFRLKPAVQAVLIVCEALLAFGIPWAGVVVATMQIAMHGKGV